jgi:glycosyltransferase involved in cell wall biosynthesis
MSREPLRVLQVVQSLETGGVERLQVTLARFHDRRRVRLSVCSFRSINGGSIATDLRAAGVAVSSLAGTRLHNPAPVLQLAKLVRAHKIDVLHSHLSTPNILAAAAGALTRRPVVSTLHNVSGLDENRSPANAAIERRALRRMPLVIAVAPQIALDAQRSLGIDPQRITCVPQGIDVMGYGVAERQRVAALRHELLRGSAGPLIVSVGSLAPRKAHELLVQATPHVIAAFPNAQVAIVGREAGNGAAVRSGVERLRLSSHVACVGERDEVAEILAAADLFVLPSRVEGVPLALLEAMAAGTPLVAAAAGGVPSVVSDRVTGRLIPPGDADALGRAMVESLSHHERTREMAARARATVEAEHRADVWAARLSERYEQVAAASALS